MAAAKPAHTHDGDGEPFDWFKLFDIVVWVAVAVIVILGIEWAFGAAIRARLGREAETFLKHRRVPAADQPSGD